MGQAEQESNRRLLRARDAIDRAYDQPLDIATLAAIAIVSEAHFIRTFKAAFGETPNRYLQRRRIERAMALLRQSELTIGEIVVEVGFASVATFARTFRDVVGETPSSFRDRGGAEPVGPPPMVPSCFEKAWNRPSSATGAPVGPARAAQDPAAHAPSSFGQAGAAARP